MDKRAEKTVNMVYDLKDLHYETDSSSLKIDVEHLPGKTGRCPVIDCDGAARERKT